MKSTNLRLSAAPLSPAFRGTPAQFFAELIRLTRIVSPDGHYGIVVADIEPESNQGLWLKNGTKPYVWSNDEAKYVPADITDGIAVQLTQLADLVSKMTAGRVLFSQLEPGETERANVVWVQTGEGGAALSVRIWDPAATAWRLLPGTVRYSVTYTGATDDEYRITLDDPASLSQLVGIPIVVLWHRTSTGPVTIVVEGLPTAANLIDSSSGQQVTTGAVREGQASQIVFDGALWQTISPLTPPAIPIKKSTGEITSLPSVGTSTSTAHNMSPKPTQVYGAMECTFGEAGYIIGDVIQLGAIKLDSSGSGDNSGDGAEAFNMTYGATLVTLTRNAASAGQATILFSKGSGVAAGFTPENWKFIFTALHIDL